MSASPRDRSSRPRRQRLTRAEVEAPALACADSRVDARARALRTRRRAATVCLPTALALALGTGGAARAQEAPAADAGTHAREETAALAQATRHVVQSLAHMVVEVEALGGLPARIELPEQAEGGTAEGVLTRRGFKQAFGPSSGLIVREDGLIATSTFALAREPRHLIVTLADGRSFVARVLGRDEGRQLALLRIEASGLPVPRFAPANDVRVGRFAVALGRGLGGLQPAASLGIVSATGRVSGRALQTSAAISPVNYGGPLVAIDGAVLGLIVPLSITGGTAGVEIYDSGIGFAIPAADLVGLIPRLEEGGELVPGFLGVVPDLSHRGVGPGVGVRVGEVAPGSPAAAAGLREGDLIHGVDGAPVDAAWQLRRALGRRFAGERVALEVGRDGVRRSFEVELGRPPRGEGQAPRPNLLPGDDGHDDHDGHDHGEGGHGEQGSGHDHDEH